MKYVPKWNRLDNKDNPKMHIFDDCIFDLKT